MAPFSHVQVEEQNHKYGNIVNKLTKKKSKKESQFSVAEKLCYRQQATWKAVSFCSLSASWLQNRAMQELHKSQGFHELL